MNDNIISLPNGDFQVQSKNSIREYLENKFKKIRPLSELDLEKMYTLKSSMNNNIQIGDRLTFVLIQTPGSNSDPKLTPDWQGFTRRVSIIIEREIAQYDAEYVLTPDSDFSHNMIVIERK